VIAGGVKAGMLEQVLVAGDDRLCAGAGDQHE